MASPWTFLARLVSPRRQQEQEHDHIEDVKPDVRGSAVSAEESTEESLSSAGQQRGEQPPLDRTDVLSAAPGRYEQTGGDVDDAVENDRSGAVEVSGQDLSDTDVSLAPGASTVEKTVETAPARRRRRAKQIAGAGVAKSSPAVPSISYETTSLDGDIRELRRQLATKLRLQNAQLRRMLERFER